MPTTHEAIAALIKGKVVFLPDKVAYTVSFSVSVLELIQNNTRLARQERAGRTVEKYHA
jgi:glutamate dehydrogenase/leucine dehydrogenase